MTYNVRFTFSVGDIEGHFTHKPRAVTLKSREPKRKCPKAIPRHLQNHVVWSRIHKCSVKPYVTKPSTKCYFNEFHSCRCSHMIKQNKPIVVSVWSVMVSRFCVRPYMQEVVFENNPSDHDPFDAMQESMQTLHPSSCIPILRWSFTSILHFITPSVPQAQCEANLDRLHLFH